MACFRALNSINLLRFNWEARCRGLRSRLLSSWKTDGPNGGAVAYQKCGEAEGEDGMVQAGAEILPKWNRWAGIVRREEQSHHENQAGDAGWTNQDPEYECNADGEFAASHQ